MAGPGAGGDVARDAVPGQEAEHGEGVRLLGRRRDAEVVDGPETGRRQPFGERPHERGVLRAATGRDDLGHAVPPTLCGGDLGSVSREGGEQVGPVDIAAEVVERLLGEAVVVALLARRLRRRLGQEEIVEQERQQRLVDPALRRAGATPVEGLVAAGGQGAPLVSLFDVLLLGREGNAPRAALNLGGIANLTVISPDAAPVAYDAGPANALLDAAVVAMTGGDEAFDRGGARAAQGRVDEALLALLLDDFFLAQPPPKTTGKERYHHGFTEEALDYLGRDVDGVDLLATLTAHAAEVAAAECRRHDVKEVVASGGGTDNPVLMKALGERLAPARLRRIDDFGIPSSAKEAYAFAVLGFLTWHGLPGNVPACTGARRAAVLGSITPGASALSLPLPARTPPSRLEVLTRP